MMIGTMIFKCVLQGMHNRILHQQKESHIQWIMTSITQESFQNKPLHFVK
jgi:hypothetical protein